MDLIHPEKCIEERYGKHYDVILRLWLDTCEGCRIKSVSEFSEVFDVYATKVDVYKAGFSAVTDLTPETPGFRTKAKQTGLYQRIVIETLKVSVVQGVLMSHTPNPTYSRMYGDARWVFLWELMQVHGKRAVDMGSLHLELMIRHAVHLFRMQGQKVYTVSPGLEWQLRNTELRNFPADEVYLPYSIIYLLLPRGYKVYNDQTGWHPAEGVYIIADDTEPRAWRMVLTAGPNENSPDVEDDALYHWTFLFPKGATVEEAIESTLEIAEGKALTTSRTAIVDGKRIQFQTGHEGSGKGFDLMKDTLLEIFRYAMNVVLYSTMPDADQTFANANPEYAKLRARALKCKSQGKRKKLLQRAQGTHSSPRIVLGGSVVVDRSEKEASDSKGKGTKHRVRTLVPGHWQRYWKGKKGEQTVFSKRKLPYWKGLEHAPLTQKKHVLKHRGE